AQAQAALTGQTHRLHVITPDVVPLEAEYLRKARAQDRVFGLALPGPHLNGPNASIGPIEAKLNTVKPIRGIVIGAFGEVSADTHSLVKEIAVQGGRKMYALMGVSAMDAAARIKKQLIDTIGTIAARGHAQLLLARLSAFPVLLAIVAKLIAVLAVAREAGAEARAGVRTRRACSMLSNFKKKLPAAGTPAPGNVKADISGGSKPKPSLGKSSPTSEGNAGMAGTIESLPLFKDVPVAERQSLFIRKLKLCCVQVDFSDIMVDVKLLELVDYINSTKNVFNEATFPE
ncbi:hypothetical protein T492DRAFT_871554, partial [Pavlovales sp. CCMP2436]